MACNCVYAAGCTVRDGIAGADVEDAVFEEVAADGLDMIDLNRGVGDCRRMTWQDHFSEPTG